MNCGQPQGKKLSIIGAGAVGTAAAHWAVAEKAADTVVLVDVVEGVPQGKALDISQAAPLCGFTGRIVGTNDYDETAESDVVIITAGIARKPGMSRDDLLDTNVRIVRQVTEEVVTRSPDACLVVVTNPIDAMVYTVYKTSGLPRNRVVGMAGVLDSARYRTFIAQALGVAPEDVTALVMGIHGDHMLPLTRLASVGGVPLEALLPPEEIQEIVRRTQHGGAEIVGHLKTGSAFTTPGLAALQMARAILQDQKRVLPCAAFLEGEFGIRGLFLGVPVVLGREGVERVLEFPLTDEERRHLQLSVEAVQRQVAATGL
ncbi:malate dehydrogenase [Dissulfurirhabdus thermomarina]|uniref:Malate dehydrogenase n=1 Tax=Dissulfurirhabdus thermomarina TaxID=1765737 RepID=A0A6N9TQA0_DISTH|nr:malate dehydrogenase [Dissulfurirhabdus thermomarina]NDY43228.1 malate dehydrogenase [Dissulfurirhabdus thermomarina]NMX22349.1 malate dehydrogenase [Dissulfurirhabdus thermomarina]